MLVLHADRYTYGRAVAILVGQHILQRVCIITEEKYLNDGFIAGFQSHFEDYKLNKSQTMLFDRNEDIPALFLKLQDIQENGYRLIIAHASSKLVSNIIDFSKMLGFVDSGFVWILTPASLPSTFQGNKDLPNGLLTMNECETIDSLLLRTLVSVVDAFQFSTHSNISTITSFKEIIIRHITGRLYNESNRGLSFYSNGRRSNITFELLNKDNNSISDDDGWRPVGYFGEYFMKLDTIYWPGNSIFGPFDGSKKTYRVVTRIAEPFVYMKSPMEPALSCFGDIQCYLVEKGDPKYLPNYIDEIPDELDVSNITYKRYCCGGIAIEMLDSLASELKFDYIIYLQNDSNYGSFVNDSWTGMMGDVISGSADIIVGAFSITSERLPHILFTEPFYYSGYRMVIPTQNARPSIDAFMRPFDTVVWFLIFFSATVTGIATSVLEWNSPFGLNPWGRKRKRNFTLGSGMVMAFSILFGHTVNTKSPKSWPSKWLQNIWAALAIFIVASYTANLAAYLAGKTAEETINSIDDPKLKDKRIAAIPSSSVMEYLKKEAMPSRNRALQYKVNNKIEALTKLRTGQIDVYLDDTPIQEFTLSKFDVNCSTKLTGREFGESFYAFGLAKSSGWLKDKLSSVIMNYVKGGYIEILRGKYIVQRSCERYEIKTIKYSLDHTGGLFIMLLITMVMSMFLMLLEHAIYKYLVPYIRKKPSNSGWKSRKIEYVSQRIYRSIMSERLVNPKQTAKEMVKLMKERDFSRLFLKNELKAQQKGNGKKDDKGLRLMNLTENLMKLQKSRSEANLVDTNDNNYKVFSTKTSGEVYRLSNGDIHCYGEENECDHEKVVFEISQDSSDEDNKTQESELTPASKRLSSDFKSDELVSNQNNFMDKSENNTEFKNIFEMRRHNDLTASRSLHDCQEEETNCDKINSATFEGDAGCLQCESKPDLPRARFGTWPVLSPNKQFKYRSLDKPQPKRNKSSTHLKFFQNVVRKCSKCNQLTNRKPVPLPSIEADDNPDYYKSALKMKDNRVKSTIRRHAIAKYRRQSSSMFDGCAIDALNKEDLLVMWKKSEIELQTKLNRVTLQNAHLKRLLRIVEDTKSSSDGKRREGKITCTRL